MDAVITGDDALYKTFKNLPSSTQRKVWTKAGRKAANVIRDAARQNVRSIVSDEATGLGARSIVVYSMKKTKDGYMRFGVMIRRNQARVYAPTGKAIRVATYMAVLEYGKEGQPPRSWIRKAARETPANVLQVATEEFKKNLDSAIQDAKR